MSLRKRGNGSRSGRRALRPWPFLALALALAAGVATAVFLSRRREEGRP